VFLVLPFRVQDARRQHLATAAAQLYFQQLLQELPGPSIVFVRYGPRHVSHYSLIQNPPDYDRAKTWIVYDRGPENGELLSRAGGRRAYLYDEERGSISELPR
jgi:hypothetical protein